MIIPRQIPTSTGVAHQALPLLMTEKETGQVTHNTELVQIHIHNRANHVSHVLNSILQEPKGQPNWGINE